MHLPEHMPLIDEALTREQFLGLPRDLVAPLCVATREDLEQCCADLLAAVAEGDETAARRARHSLRGVAGNYGGDRLIALATHSLAPPDARALLLETLVETLAAIEAIAAEIPD